MDSLNLYQRTPPLILKSLFLCLLPLIITLAIICWIPVALVAYKYFRNEIITHVKAVYQTSEQKAQHVLAFLTQYISKACQLFQVQKHLETISTWFSTLNKTINLKANFQNSFKYLIELKQTIPTQATTLAQKLLEPLKPHAERVAITLEPLYRMVEPLLKFLLLQVNLAYSVTYQFLQKILKLLSKAQQAWKTLLAYVLDAILSRLPLQLNLWNGGPCNYGYALIYKTGKSINNLDPDLEPHRFQIQLYQYVATSLWQQKTLKGQSVLEIDFPSEIGLTYISEALQPERAVGITERPVQKLNGTQAPKVELVSTPLNAITLKEQFDLIISVQRLEKQPKFDQILAQVPNLLKSTGSFLLADCLSAGQLESFERKLNENGLRITDRIDISLCVKQALKLQQEIRAAELKSNFLRHPLNYLQAFFMRDSEAFKQLANKSKQYMVYNLKKQE